MTRPTITDWLAFLRGEKERPNVSGDYNSVPFEPVKTVQVTYKHVGTLQTPQEEEPPPDDFQGWAFGIYERGP